MKKIFKFPHLSPRDLCAAAMLMAITAILAIYCTFRIGNTIKIPIKFISVFISAVLFGPWIGGLCGAVGDILNAVLMPVGPFLPQLTCLEFLSGFVFGVFFYNRKTRGVSYILRALGAAAAMFLIDMLLSTAVLVNAGYFPSFKTAFVFRIWAGVIKAGLQLAFILVSSSYLELLIKHGRGINREK